MQGQPFKPEGALEPGAAELQDLDFAEENGKLIPPEQAGGQFQPVPRQLQPQPIKSHDGQHHADHHAE